MVPSRRQTLGNYCEPIPIEEQFASGVANIAAIGNGIYMTFYVDHISPPELGLARARRICVRLTLPRKGAQRLRRMLEAALAAKPQPTAEDLVEDAEGEQH